MANQLILGRALGVNGYIEPGAKATVYADGTSTLITVYSDVAGTIPAANPIIADGDGFWPQRYVSEDAKVVVTDANDAPLYTLDPAPVAQGTGAAASSISFTPTLDLPQTNVQAAIEAAGALAVSGFAAFGLGITGNATLLANLDATGTGAGVYRFDGTTTGTFPTGVAAGDTGMVELWRQAGATAMQFLFHATTDRVFSPPHGVIDVGRLAEVLTSNQALAEGDTFYRGASSITRLAKGTAGQVLTMNAGATAPEWQTGGAKVQSWGSFSAIPGGSGTYSRTGTTITVTQTAHGMTTGQGVYLDFTTGTATDDFYFITVIDANTYTVTDTASGSTSGNFSRTIWLRAGANISTIIKAATGIYTVTMASAMSDAFYAPLVSGNQSNDDGAGDLNDWFTTRVISSSQFRVRCYDQSGVAIDPASFYFAVIR